MATLTEVVPPVAAIVAIGSLEIFFPENRIEGLVRLYEDEFRDEAKAIFRNFLAMVVHLARGWQTTVDLVYTILATLTLLVSRMLESDLQWTRPVFWTLLVLLVLNGGLLFWCATIGPEMVVAAPVRMPVLGWYLTPRQISVFFVITANLIVIAAIISEICLFPKPMATPPAVAFRPR
jgi:hypothetical protein